MRIGFLTACLPQLGLEELVRWAAAQGFKALELAAWPVDSTRDYQARQLDAQALTPSEASRVREIFATHGVTISALAYYDNNIDPDLAQRQAHLEHLKRVITSASLLGVDLVGTFVGARPDRLPTENMREIGSIFRGLTRFAADHGVRLMIENCPMEHWQRFGLPGNFAYSPELWDALFNEVPDENFGLNFDPSHLLWLGIDYLRAAREFAPKIFHAHAKDTEMLSDGTYRYGVFGRQIDPVPWKSGWWRYRMPGLGSIDWKSLIATLRSAGYDHVLSIEHEDPVWEGSVEKIQGGLKLALAHLSPFVA